MTKKFKPSVNIKNCFAIKNLEGGAYALFFHGKQLKAGDLKNGEVVTINFKVDDTKAN